MYSVKTNYHSAVLETLRKQEAGMEVVSGFELYLVLKMGFSPSKIVFNGPCKSNEDLELAIKNDLLLINADSFSELKRIDKMAAKNHKRINVGLRLNTRYTWKKFGVPIQYSEQFFRAGAKLKNIKLNSIHVHLGTDIHSTTPYTHAVADVTRLMSLLKKSGIARVSRFRRRIHKRQRGKVGWDDILADSY
jgi:diaminopimelate decarboxylase